MASWIKVRAISRSQNVRVGNQKVTRKSEVWVNLDDSKIRRDLEHHLALGAVIVTTNSQPNTGSYVSDGGARVTASSPATLVLNVAAGTLTKDGGATQAIAGGTVTVTAADATNPRIDNVVITDSSGVASVVAGTPAAVPVRPAIAGGTTLIAEVSVPANDTAITQDQITDRRVAVAVQHNG